MEPSKRFHTNLKELGKAINGFNLSLSINPENYASIEADLIRNGWLQKFEYCTELSWKLGKVFLEWKTGLLVSSPKLVYREIFSNQYISENLCEAMFKTINDRNKLSHIYKEELFVEVIENIPSHRSALLEILAFYQSVYNQSVNNL
jgi:nucleotidyltransferase substrate binding protein (TIGR01987 family)